MNLTRTMESVLKNMRQQHLIDLQVYRMAHLEWRNRALHWFLIPIECWSALLLSMALLSPLVTVLLGLVLGVLSLMIATDPVRGGCCLVFHVLAIALCFLVSDSIVETGHMSRRFWLCLIAAIFWIIAWVLQVGVGHWMWERNQPNVANINTVSYLAMCQSVLIAWSS